MRTLRRALRITAMSTASLVLVHTRERTCARPCSTMTDVTSNALRLRKTLEMAHKEGKRLVVIPAISRMDMAIIDMAISVLHGDPIPRCIVHADESLDATADHDMSGGVRA